MSQADRQTDDELDSINTKRYQGEEKTEFGQLTTEELLENL